jgi:uncharacterized LabA/DUF88 family protein
MQKKEKTMRNRKRVWVVDDAANLAQGDPGWRVNHAAILAYAARLGVIVQAGIYFPRYNGMERDRNQLIALKQAAEFTEMEVRPVRQRPDGTYKSDIDTVITMVAWGAAVTGMADVVVLASGDSDFVPLVEGLIQRGIEVHVIGPDNGTAIELAVAASCFVYASQVPGLVEAGNGFRVTTTAGHGQPERTAERVVSNGNGHHTFPTPSLQKPN